MRVYGEAFRGRERVQVHGVRERERESEREYERFSGGSSHSRIYIAYGHNFHPCNMYSDSTISELIKNVAYLRSRLCIQI